MARPGLRLVEPTARRARRGVDFKERARVSAGLNIKQKIHDTRSGPGNIGMVEYWVKKRTKYPKIASIPLNPVFQYSIIPLFQIAERSGANLIRGEAPMCGEESHGIQHKRLDEKGRIQQKEFY